MFEIVLLAYLTFRNSVRARQKGLNAVLWAGLTVLSFFFAFAVGVELVITNFMHDAIDLQQMSAMDPAAKTEAARKFLEAFYANPLNIVTANFFGIGGYLLIRYILEKKPGKKQPEVHWMDKLGEKSRES